MNRGILFKIIFTEAFVLDANDFDCLEKDFNLYYSFEFIIALKPSPPTLLQNVKRLLSNNMAVKIGWLFRSMFNLIVLKGALSGLRQF